MSCYTTLNINIIPKCSLTEQDINIINEKTKFDCEIGSYKNIDTNNIDLNITFNHGLNKMTELIELLETFCNYKKLTEVGKFETEDLAGLYYAKVFMYATKLFIVKTGVQNGFIQQNIYSISDLRGKQENYSSYIDKNSPNEKLIKETFIKEFLKKSYNL